MICTGADIVRVRHPVLHEPHGRRFQFAISLVQTSGQIGKRAVFCRSALVVDHFEKRLHGASAILRKLTANEIHGLNAVCAFVDHRNARIADILLHAPFADVTMTAKDLLCVGCDFVALIGAIAFDHRGQQRQQIIGHLPLGLGLCALQQICL